MVADYQKVVGNVISIQANRFQRLHGDTVFACYEYCTPAGNTMVRQKDLAIFERVVMRL